MIQPDSFYEGYLFALGSIVFGYLIMVGVHEWRKNK